MIAFACPKCSKHLQVKDEVAGKHVRCLGCGTVLAAPAVRVERTLTLAEPDKVAAPPSVDSSAEDTAGGSPKAGGHPAELTDFLAPPQAPDEIGRLGPYRVLAILGHGGMGVVFKARDPQLARLVALKAMLPALAGNASARERFFREARAAAALKHPHVVTIHQVGEDRGAPYLAMEFLEGEALDERLKREGRLPVPEVLRIGREVTLGLAAAHAQGLVHRDVKPANIWLEGPQGHVKLLDFGLARSLADQTHLTQTGAIIGTPAYMAPEQAMGQVIGTRGDLFSLGCVLYRMATGRMPFPGSSTLAILSALAMTAPPAPRDMNPDIPEPLSELIMRLLAKKPEERPGTAREVAAALAALREDATTAMAPRRPLTGVTSRSRRWKWAVALAAVLVVGVVAVGWIWFGKSPPDTSGATSTVAKQGPGPSDVQGIPKTFTNSIGMEFVLVRRGEFLMGGGGGRAGDKEVAIRHDFYLGKYEVTQEQWQTVMGANPSHFSRMGGGKDAVKDIPEVELKRFPVENVSWDDAQVFLKLLNFAERGSGWLYRLPREAEWEYACRGGPSANLSHYAFHFYLDKPSNQLLPGQANFKHGKGLKRTCKVGSYAPNRLGLYDMHGNVWEWCDDSAEGASRRVDRGGDWNDDSGRGRAARRNADAPSFRYPGLGVRLARVPVGLKAK